MKTQKLKLVFIMLFAILFISGFITFSDSCITAAKNSVDLCLYSVIPSLFPFFVCSRFIIASNLSDKLAKYFSNIMKPLFKINGNGASAFVLGIISGYPIGAKTVSSLYGSNNISKNEAERLLVFTNNSGPLFIFGTVAGIFFKNKSIGVILLISHLLSAIITGFVFRFKAEETVNYKPINKTYRFSLFSNFTESVSDSVNTILIVCGYIIFFSVISELIKCSSITLLLSKFFNINNELVNSMLYSLIEITSGISYMCSTSLSLRLKILLSSFFLSFGGLSVYFQVKAVLTGQKIYGKFYLKGKLIQGVVSVIITFLLLEFIPLTNAVSFSFTKPTSSFTINYTYSYILMIFLVITNCIIKSKKIKP